MSDPTEKRGDDTMTTPIDPKFMEMAKGINAVLCQAFKQYTEAFGEQPHGTEKQIAGLSEFGIKRWVAQALASVASTKPTTQELRRLVREIRKMSWDLYSYVLYEEAAMKLLEDSK